MLSIILAYIKIVSYFCCDMTMSLTLFLSIKRFGYQEKNNYCIIVIYKQRSRCIYEVFLFLILMHNLNAMVFFCYFCLFMYNQRHYIWINRYSTKHLTKHFFTGWLTSFYFNAYLYTLYVGFRVKNNTYLFLYQRCGFFVFQPLQGVQHSAI